MRAYLLTCCMVLVTCAGMSQTPVPEFGIITPSEKKLTECPFDKEADAVIIFEKAKANHNDDQNLITEYHVRIKILKSKGIERGDVQLIYYSKNDFEKITGIRAAVTNIDEQGNQQTKEIDKTAIFRQKRNEYTSTVRFALPNVRVGSIIEYEYTSTQEHYGGLDHWDFQTDIPTMLSSYDLAILPNLEFAYQVQKSEELPITIKPDKNEGRILFEMKDVAGLRDEPYMDAPRDYIQRIEFQLSATNGRFGKTKYMTTWDELARELSGRSDFGVQLNKNISGAASLVEEAKKKATPFAQMNTIYQYLQRTITWNGYSTRFVPDGLKDVWEKKKGASAEINLLLINLLREAGLEAYPLLVSNRQHGKVRVDYPFLDQFNGVMAYVVIGDNKYILDAAGPYTPPELIPFDVVNTKGFIVHRKKSGIIPLTEKKRLLKNRAIINATLGADGKLTGETVVNSFDYARLERMHAFKQNKQTLLEAYFTKNYAELKTDSFTVSNEDNDSLPLVQRLQFTAQPNTSGEYLLLNLNLFTNFHHNPFISDIRFTNVDFGCVQQHEILTMINLPENVEPEGLPKDIRMIMPDTSISFSRYIRYSDHSVSAMYRIEMSRPVYPADEYPLLKEFYKKMINLLNEQLVVKKK